jgi:hypothetical protein
MSNTTIGDDASRLEVAFMIDSTQDADDVGVLDSNLDDSLKIGTEDDIAGGDEAAQDLEIGEFIQPVRNLGADTGEADKELDIGSWIQEAEYASGTDNLDGPVMDSPLLEVAPELSSPMNEELEDDAENPDEKLESDELPALDFESELLDDASIDIPEAPAADPNDLAISWSAQPWSEYCLTSAFVPRVSLVCQRNVMVAVGDATDALSLDELAAIDAVELPGKSRAATFLDEDARRVIIVTVTGKLIVWHREEGRIEQDTTRRLSQLDQVMEIWHEPTGQGPVWLRLASGELMRGGLDLCDFEQVPALGRCVAIGGSGPILRGMFKQSQRLSLLAVEGDDVRTSLLPRELEVLAQPSSILLVTLGQVVIVGARDYGLWMSTDDGTTFRKVAGCRNVTACQIGSHCGRIQAWAALFYELDDRAELVTIDCKNLRVQKLAEYRVVTDSSGPEDDPPERARIDCLIWDAPRQRILAAGCFGLTCFMPPAGPQKNS